MESLRREVRQQRAADDHITHPIFDERPAISRRQHLANIAKLRASGYSDQHPGSTQTLGDRPLPRREYSHVIVRFRPASPRLRHSAAELAPILALRPPPRILEIESTNSTPGLTGPHGSEARFPGRGDRPFPPPQVD